MRMKNYHVLNNAKVTLIFLQHLFYLIRKLNNIKI